MGAAMGWLQLREDYNGYFIDILSESVGFYKFELTGLNLKFLQKMCWLFGKVDIIDKGYYAE